jgi:hypothetical protein
MMGALLRLGDEKLAETVFTDASLLILQGVESVRSYVPWPLNFANWR